MKSRQALIKRLSRLFINLWIAQTLVLFFLSYLLNGLIIENWLTAVFITAMISLFTTLLWPLLTYSFLPSAVLPMPPTLKGQPELEPLLPSFNSANQSQARPYVYLPKLASLRMLAQQDKTAGYLQRSRHLFASIYNNAFFIEVMALQSLAQPGSNQHAETADNAEALSRFTQLLTDLDPQIKQTLAQSEQPLAAPDFAAEMRSAMADLDGLEPLHGGLERKSASAKTFHSNEEASEQLQFVMLETLTNREMDVLIWLAERLTNKEIAQKLGISTCTVKRHTVNIYQKMGVNNRRQAMVQARKLGILPN